MVGMIKGSLFAATFKPTAADEIASAAPKGRRVAAPSHSYEEIEYRTGDNGQDYPFTVPYMEVICAKCGNRTTVHGHERRRMTLPAASCATHARKLKATSMRSLDLSPRLLVAPPHYLIHCSRPATQGCIVKMRTMSFIRAAR